MRKALYVILCSLTLAGFTSCENDPATVQSFTRVEKGPVQTAYDVKLFYSDSAQLKIHLTAPEVNEFIGSSPYTELPKGLKVDFYDDSMKINTSLTARYGIRKEREQMMEVKNDVVVINVRGEKLNTEKLIWDGIRRKIYTDAFVKITTADQVLMGNGLESDETFSEYEIKNLTGTILLKDGVPAED
ncbi:MAG: hypothetical protein Fur0041_05320 [Bacteroidia bacterium]